MNNFWSIAIAMIYLFGPEKVGNFLYPKGKCPFKDGVMRKLTHPKGVVVGTEESTVDICGKDSIVLSATDGRVMDVIALDLTSYIIVRVDTTAYTYIDIDRFLVKEGQIIKAGEPIAIAKADRISFFVSNYLGKIFHNPDAYVDCTCELAKAAQH